MKAGRGEMGSGVQQQLFFNWRQGMVFRVLVDSHVEKINEGMGRCIKSQRLIFVFAQLDGTVHCVCCTATQVTTQLRGDKTFWFLLFIVTKRQIKISSRHVKPALLPSCSCTHLYCFKVSWGLKYTCTWRPTFCQLVVCSTLFYKVALVLTIELALFQSYIWVDRKKKKNTCCPRIDNSLVTDVSEVMILVPVGGTEDGSEEWKPW